jgi:hypothetical protein
LPRAGNGFMEELRLTRRLHRYWDHIRKEREFPDIYQLNTSAIEDVWPFCFKVSIDTSKGISYKYEYMGEPIAKLYGDDMTGRAIEHNARDFPGSVIHTKIPQAVETRLPLTDDGHFVNRLGQMIKYRACILPFGNDKDGVTHVVVGLSCRVFT